MVAIKISDLRKEYPGQVTALQGLDLEVQSGEIYGFLGPNGAGKSTTIDILLGFTSASGGNAHLLESDVSPESVDIRSRIGVLPEGVSAYERLSGREHLQFVADVKDVDEDIEALLERVGLEVDAADRATGGYSKGMTQRLNLAMALVGEPEILILDEPSSGLDPKGIRRMRRILRAEAERGAAVFFSSHLLAEVEAICDRVGVLHDGALKAEGTVDGIQESMRSFAVLSVETDGIDDTAVQSIEALPSVEDVEVEGTTLDVSIPSGAKFDVLDALRETRTEVIDFSLEEPSIEDFFDEHTGTKEGVSS